MESRFDTLAKLLASGMSRREALRRLSGTAAGAVLAALGLGCRDDVVGPLRPTGSEGGPLFKKSPTKDVCKEACKGLMGQDKQACEDACEVACQGALICPAPGGGDVCCPPGDGQVIEARCGGDTGCLACFIPTGECMPIPVSACLPGEIPCLKGDRLSCCNSQQVCFPGGGCSAR